MQQSRPPETDWQNYATIVFADPPSDNRIEFIYAVSFVSVRTLDANGQQTHKMVLTRRQAEQLRDWLSSRIGPGA